MTITRTNAICTDRRDDGTIVPGIGGSVGGDHQVGEAWEVRYVPADNEARTVKTALTIYAFASDEFTGEDRDEEDRFFDYCVMTEILQYTDENDPGGTEINTEYQYEWPSINGFATAEEADAAAKQYAAQDFSAFINFDKEEGK